MRKALNRVGDVRAVLNLPQVTGEKSKDLFTRVFTEMDTSGDRAIDYGFFMLCLCFLFVCIVLGVMCVCVCLRLSLEFDMF